MSAVEVNLDVPEQIDFSVQNLGRTAAVLIEWSAQHNRSSEPIPEQPLYRWEMLVRGTVLRPDALEKLIAWPAIDETSVDLNRREVPIFFWGYFRYEDVLGRTHTTGFGYRGAFNFLGNFYSWQRAGGEAYNYDRDESEG